MRFEYADDRMPVAVKIGGATYYLSYDQVGSLRLVADGSGNVVKRISYDSFGNILEDTNPSFTIPFGFAGGLHDRDTGLVRFGYRDFDPEVGRWTAKDPIGFDGGDTDLYGYVLNNPVNWVDPYGLLNWGKLAAGVLSVADGSVMVGVATGVTVGTFVLTQNPVLTGAIGLMMIPVATIGVMDIIHGVQIVGEALREENPLLAGAVGVVVPAAAVDAYENLLIRDNSKDKKPCP
jgi:RHS repeat-associated protein